MADQSLQTKQKYLRDKILQKGHDAQAFMAYCQSNYGEIDLQGWSYDKLKAIAKGFLGQNLQQTFTQEQLDNQYQQQFIEYEEPVDTHQQQNKIHQHVITQHQHIVQSKIETKKQFVFSDADWEIFGLGPPPAKKQINLATLQFSTISNFSSMSPPSVPSQNKQQPYQVPIQQIQPSSIVTPTSINPALQESIFTAVLKQQKKRQKTQQYAYQPKTQPKQFQQLKPQQITQIVPNNKISKIGTIQVNVIASKQLPNLLIINDVKIIKTQQKTKNFLQGDYTLYHIQFTPCNHVIQRKFNDFRKLRSILQKIYPHIRLPYIQPQGWLVNSSQAKDPQTLTKFKYMIVQFLKYITIRNDLLKKSKIVRIFTGLVDGNPTDFKKYQNIVKPKIYSQLCLPNGKLFFSKYQNLSPIDKYMNNTQILSCNVDLYYEKLRKAMQTLFYNYQQVSKSLLQVGSIFQSLQTLVQKFNFDNDQSKDLRVFQGIKEVCLKMKESIDGQHDVFKNSIHTLFKYERDNMTTLKQVNEIRTKMFNEYCKQGLHSKKTSQYLPKGQAIVQGNISIQQPCKTNKNILTIQNMFWSHFTLKNAQQYWNQLRFKINQKLTLLAYTQLDQENKNLNFWNSVIKKCVI